MLVVSALHDFVFGPAACPRGIQVTQAIGEVKLAILERQNE